MLAEHAADSAKFTAKSSMPGNVQKKRTFPNIVWKARPRACSTYARERPIRCEDTISPDTFHLKVEQTVVLTWSVFQTFAEIYRFSIITAGNAADDGPANFP